MLNVAVPFPPPDKLYPELWSFGFYGLLFLVGAGLFEHKDKIAQIAKQFHWLLLLATVSTVGYFYVLPPAFTIEQVIEAAKAGSSAPKVIAFVPVITQTIAILSLTFVSFIAGYKWLNVETAQVVICLTLLIGFILFMCQFCYTFSLRLLTASIT